MTNWFMARSESPMGHVLALRNVALFLVRNDTSLGEVSLVAPEILKYRNIRVSKTSLQMLLIRSIHELSRDLANELFLGLQNYQKFNDSGLTLELLADSEVINEFTNGFSILQTPCVTTAKDLLIDHVLKPENIHDWFQETSSGFQINETRVSRYLTLSNRFLRTLLALCHMTSRAPARGTEINQVMWRNSSTTNRNLYLDPETRLFLIQLAYSKNFWRANMASNSIRVLPESISYLVLVYLAAIRPFEAFLTLNLKGNLPYNDFLLFFNIANGHVISSRQLSRTLGSLTLRILGQKISIASWRQITQAFIRYSLKEDPLADFGNDEDELFNMEALAATQMHHSRDTVLCYYGRQLASFQGIKPDHQASMVDNPIAQETTDSRGISLPNSQPIVQFKMPRVGNTRPPATPISIGQFHEYLSLYGSGLANQSPLPQLASSSQLDAFQKLQLDRLPSSSLPKLDSSVLEAILQDFLQDQEAIFRSLQHEAFYLLLSKLPYLLVILPTAAGKTTLFLLLASLVTHRSLVIISPLISLKLDLMTKAAAIGLQPIEWDEGQIEHIIGDECHLIPLTKHYRTLMTRVDHVLRVPVPMVFSSATLSHAAEQELLKIVRLDHFPREIPRVRANLTLPNMAYHVIHMPGSLANRDYPKYLPEYLGLAIAQFHADLSEAEKMAELGCFHGNQVGGQARVLLATLAIGAGFDFPNVDLVVHLEGLYGLSDFMQESGRAARNPRQLGWSYCLIRKSELTPRLGDSHERQDSHGFKP
ncbi:DEAD/DEAH box helicase [Aspergillus undulatus]|uniref:DEAD/DEAH box helicase n=1 Tax=Aspergillus undulatus TaxID=1810928 RepID=UPI003CCE2C98